jgi:hypothetical protein
MQMTVTRPSFVLGDIEAHDCRQRLAGGAELLRSSALDRLIASKMTHATSGLKVWATKNQPQPERLRLRANCIIATHAKTQAR